MPRKPIELPPAVARAFVKDMRAFLVEKNAIKRDEIAGSSAARAQAALHRQASAIRRERDVSADAGLWMNSSKLGQPEALDQGLESEASRVRAGQRVA
jgi:hypothetical protein